jgi:hypothetical protein
MDVLEERHKLCVRVCPHTNFTNWLDSEGIVLMGLKTFYLERSIISKIGVGVNSQTPCHKN